MNEKANAWEDRRSLDEQLRRWLLGARATAEHNATASVTDKTYELLLLRGDVVVSAGGEGKTRINGRRLGEVLSMGAQAVERAGRYLAAPTHEMMAFLLPERERLLLLAPVPGLKAGESVGFLLDLDAASAARVLARSFGGAVAMDDEVRCLLQTPMRESDERTYGQLCRLLGLWRYVTTMTDIRIEDRRALSHQLMRMGKLVLALLGDNREYADEIFPLAYPFAGSWRGAPAVWMMLCLGCGLLRMLPFSLSELHVAPERERLLPMVEIPGGNRTVLPSEWQECRRVAERYGMLFEIRRQRGSIRVVFCPMTPDEDPNTFYSMRAGLALRARLQGWGFEQDKT